jgi:medium-chain acyl-[acyl-carrier-protein] hydrolase
MRLFCFGYAGGNAFTFLSWQAALDPAIEVCAVQLPGRGTRIAEAAMSSMPALLRALAPVIAEHGDLPYAFFGHSVGALIGFELARYLQIHGVTGPMHLFMSGCQAPQHRSPSRQLHTLPDAALIEALRDYNGTPPGVLESQELMALLLPAIRVDFAIAESYRYRPGPLLRIPISVFSGTQDDNKGPGQIDGWKSETTGACEIYTFEGGHFFVTTRRDDVLKQLNAELTESLFAQRMFRDARSLHT